MTCPHRLPISNECMICDGPCELGHEPPRYLNFRGVGYTESLADWRKSYFPDPTPVLRATPEEPETPDPQVPRR